MSKNYLLKLENVSKSFTGAAGSKQTVLEDINFTLSSGTSENIIASFIASFGSGKSTLLKIIAGLEKQTEGNILFGDAFSKSRTNEVVYIPEKSSSFPWLNVEENINFGLKFAKNDCNDKELIEAVGLTGYENHHPNNKSLGFRFRITLARALAVKPKLLLIDESFKRMNNNTRDEIYELLKSISNKFNVSILLATSNIAEAVYLSNKIYLMKKKPGRIFDEIDVNQDTMKSMGLNARDRFASLKNEIETLFSSAGENFHSQ